MSGLRSRRGMRGRCLVPPTQPQPGGGMRGRGVVPPTQPQPGGGMRGRGVVPPGEPHPEPSQGIQPAPIEQLQPHPAQPGPGHQAPNAQQAHRPGSPFGLPSNPQGQEVEGNYRFYRGRGHHGYQGRRHGGGDDRR